MSHQKLSALRFIPFGNEVSRDAIHWLSLIFCRMGLSFHSLSITITVRLSTEWPLELQRAATGFSATLLCTLSAGGY